MYEKMFIVTRHWENTNQNHNEILLRIHQDGYYRKKKKKEEEGREEEKTEKEKKNNKQCGNSSKN